MSVSSRRERDATSSSAGPAFKRLASSATSWQEGSSPRPSKATSSGLEALLAHDVELSGDGGGKVPALARSLRGRSRVARTLINWFRLGARLPGVSLRPIEINGGPGALYLDAQQRLIGVIALDIAAARSRASARSSTPTS